MLKFIIEIERIEHTRPRARAISTIEREKKLVSNFLRVQNIYFYWLVLMHSFRIIRKQLWYECKQVSRIEEMVNLVTVFVVAPITCQPLQQMIIYLLGVLRSEMRALTKSSSNFTFLNSTHEFSVCNHAVAIHLLLKDNYPRRIEFVLCFSVTTNLFENVRFPHSSSTAWWWLFSFLFCFLIVVCHYFSRCWIWTRATYDRIAYEIQL